MHRTKKSYPLHGCKGCMVSDCQEQQQLSSPTEAAGADQLSVWRRGYPDTQDLHVAALSSSIIIKDLQQQRQHCALSTPQCPDDQAATAVLRGIHRSKDSSLDSQQQGFTGRRFSTTSAVAGDADDDTPVCNHRSSHDYDVVVEMAVAAAAAAARGQDDHDSQLAIATSSPLQQEMEDLQRMQAELQSAVECLGIQGLKPLPPAPATPGLKPQDSSGSKHGLLLDAALAPGKRQRRVEQQQTQQAPDLSRPVAVLASGARSDHIRPQQQQAQQQQQQRLMMIWTPSPLGPADPKRAKALPVPRCGQCKTCNNLQLRKGCVVNRRRYNRGLPFIVPDGADSIPRSVAKQHALAAARASAAGSSDAAATVGNGLAGLLLSSAGFRPVSSAAAAGHGNGSANAATGGQAPAAVQILVGAGFTPANMALSAREQPAAGDGQSLLGKSGVNTVEQNNHQQRQLETNKTTATATAAGATRNPEDLLKSLDQQIDVLCADISDWCLSNLAADHADVDKTLQVMQQLTQQLWHNYQQTGQQLFINGLEILGEIVGAFTALPAAGAKVVLACNSQRRVSGACCPDNQPCSVLELIMSCWFKEMQDSGFTGVEAEGKDTAATGGGSPRPSSDDLIKQQQVIKSGQCQAVLRLIAQLSLLQNQVYYGPLAAGVELEQIQGQKEVAAALRKAVINVMSGTALLMLQGPEAGSTSSSNSKIWIEYAAWWHQCLLRCKWAVANKSFNSNGVNSAASLLTEVVRELERLVSELLALKESEGP